MTSRIKLVLADDHRLVREGLRWMLTDEDGVDIVGQVANGAELIDFVSTHDVDVVLLDVRMPGSNGIDALEPLRDASPSTRIVMLSMHDEPAIVRRAIELGASGYLLKSVDREELLRALRTVADGGAYLQGDLTGPLVADVAGEQEKGLPALSRRERQVLQLISQGLENKQIAHQLQLSEATVKTYLKSAFATLKVRTRAEAVAVAMRTGIIE